MSAGQRATRTLLVNRDKPPFDNPDLRRAMALSLDRKAFIDILTEGRAISAATMLPPPEGRLGHAAGDAARRCPAMIPMSRRTAPRRARSWRSSATGPDKRLAVKVSTRNISGYRDPAVILIDQLKEIYIDGELDTVDTALWYPKIVRKDFTVGAQCQREQRSTTPTSSSTRITSCGAERNYTGYCNPEVDKLIDQQSMEADQESASSWCGRSNAGWPRTAPGRSSSTPRQATCRQPVGQGADA